MYVSNAAAQQCSSLPVNHCYIFIYYALNFYVFNVYGCVVLLILLYGKISQSRSSLCCAQTPDPRSCQIMAILLTGLQLLKFRVFSTGWYLFHMAIKLFPDFLHREHRAWLEPIAQLVPELTGRSCRKSKVQMSESKLIKRTYLLRKLSAAYEANISLSVWRPFCHQSIFHYFLASLCDAAGFQTRGWTTQGIRCETYPEDLCVGKTSSGIFWVIIV